MVQGVQAPAAAAAQARKGQRASGAKEHFADFWQQGGRTASRAEEGGRTDGGPARGKAAPKPDQAWEGARSAQGSRPQTQARSSQNAAPEDGRIAEAAALHEGMSPEEDVSAREELVMAVLAILGLDMAGPGAELAQTVGTLVAAGEVAPGDLEQWVLAAAGEQDKVAFLTEEGLLEQVRQLEQTFLARGWTLEEAGTQAPAAEALAAEVPELLAGQDADMALEGHGQALQSDAQPRTVAGERMAGGGREAGSRGDDSRQAQSKTVPEAFVAPLDVFAAKQLLEGAELSRPQALAGELDTESLLRQIMDQMRLRLGPDMDRLEMQLHPEHLGKLYIQLISKGGVISAQVQTESEAVRQALESQLHLLKESFARQGLQVQDVEVGVQTNAFGRQMEQGGQAGGDFSGQRGQNRRRFLREAGSGLAAAEEPAVEPAATDGLGTVEFRA